MLTDNKEICSREYWNKIYAGNNDNAKVDASNTIRPANTFDRFGWVVRYVEGPNVLEVAAGHAHVCKRVKAMRPEWNVIASDQCNEAIKVANFHKYIILNAYDMVDRLRVFGRFNTIICCQAMEYMDDQERFLNEAKKVANKLLITVPVGEMAKWSQLRIYTEENVKELLAPYGTIEVFERHENLLLVKLKLNV